jgi:hypothetical protein
VVGNLEANLWDVLCIFHNGICELKTRFFYYCENFQDLSFFSMSDEN